MHVLSDYASVPLDHQADFLRGEQSYIVAASEDGKITVIGPDYTVHEMFKAPSQIAHIRVHPSKKLILIACDDSQIHWFNFSGTLLGSWKSKNQPLACTFDFAGEKLILASLETVEEISMELFSLKTDDAFPTLELLDSTIIEDPFIESACFLTGSKSAGILCLTLGRGGVPGSQGYWISPNDKLEPRREPALFNSGIPIFAPDGCSFLTLDSDGKISRFNYPKVESRACWGWEGEEDMLEGIYFFLNDSVALVASVLGRIFRLDTVSLKLIDEVEISEHAPKPIEYYAPRRVVSSDLTVGALVEDTVAMVFRRDWDPKSPSQEWKHTILLAPASSFLR